MASFAALAADLSSKVELKIDRVFVNEVGRGKALVSVTNQSRQVLSVIGIKCAFLRDGAPIATGAGIASNVPPGVTATEEIGGVGPEAFDSARCRVLWPLVGCISASIDLPARTRAESLSICCVCEKLDNRIASKGGLCHAKP